jgi:magnesium transporter
MLYMNDGTTPREAISTGDHQVRPSVWLDLASPTDIERAVAEKLTGLRVPSREDLAEIENSSRAYTEHGVIYLSMSYAFLAADGRSHMTPVGFVLSDTQLLTVRFETLPAFETYAASFGRGEPKSSAEAFIGLAEAIVDRIADVLERAAADLDQLSKATFQSEDGTQKRTVRRADQELRRILTKVGEFGDRLGNLRDSVLGLGRIISYAHQTVAKFCSPDLVARLATLKQDIASLNDYDQQLGNKTSFLLDAVLGFISIEQNNGVKVLTVVSVVGIPPTFIVGLYGMNFKNMPEYDWAYGYQYGLGLVLLSIVIPIIWFRVKGWI